MVETDSGVINVSAVYLMSLSSSSGPFHLFLTSDNGNVSETSNCAKAGMQQSRRIARFIGLEADDR